ncbi:MAG: DUF3553 domain-containing protein, partial [Proteobacteria bacterium]|nr:DUF3553 domain-containing protein [Pseudomonadota bacterium]
IGARGKDLAGRVGLAWDYYRPIMEAKFDDYPSRMSDINEFLSLAKGYTSVTRFLADMALDPPNTSTSRPGQGGSRLTLSTVHSAKGLEWQVVFIIWAAEGRFPPAYAMKKPDDMDEERRLMYVAATRAEDHLYLICPLEADAASAWSSPRLSRFLSDIPPGLVAMEDEAGAESEPFPRRPVSEPAPPPADGFAVGERVNHPAFGLGRVVASAGGRKIKVDFDHFGTKTLHLDYAGLRRA